MSISAKDVKALREKTGAGMMDCKKVLVEAEGDFEKAIELLRKKGLASAGKKAGRVAAEGLVVAYIAEGAKEGALLELNCETDFVAKTDGFKDLSVKLTKQILDKKPADLNAYMASDIDGESVESLVNQSIATIGEKITPRRFATYQAGNGLVHSYIHAGGSIGVLIELSLADTSKADHDAVTELKADLAMHIAAQAPSYLNREEVPHNEVQKELEIYREQLKKEGKPENMLDKIAEGKLNKYYQDVCFLEQPFVKESKVKISKLLENVGKEVGTKIDVPRFTRYVLGEGIEKKEEDFAEEVAKAAGQ